METKFKETEIGWIPDDWELLPFDNFVDKKGSKGKYQKLQTKDYLNEGQYPIVDQGQEFIAGYTNDENDVYTGNLPVTIFGDHTLIVKFVNMEFAIGADGTVLLYPNKNKLTDKFFYYLISNHKIKSEGYQRHLKYLRKKRFAIPPLPEQHKIAEILSTVDETIEGTDAIIEETQQLKKGLMQKLFTEGIGHARFKETKIGRIPEGWEVAHLGDFCERITKGTTPTSVGFGYQDTGINFIKVESIDSNGNFLPYLFAHINNETHNALERSIIKENDLLFSIAGALGRVALANKEILPANINQALGIIRLKQSSAIDVKYLYFYLKGPQIQKHIQQINVQSAQANLTLAHLNKFRVLLPPLDEQCKIAEILSETDAKIETEQAYKAELEQLKKGLMQVLLTGKVRVKV